MGGIEVSIGVGVEHGGREDSLLGESESLFIASPGENGIGIGSAPAEAEYK